MVINSILHVYTGAALIEGFLAILLLLVLPGDQKNIWLFGFSKARLLMFAMMATAVLSIVWFKRKLVRDEPWSKKVLCSVRLMLSNKDFVIIFFAVSIIGFITGVHLLNFGLTSTDEFVQILLLRLAPLIFWLTTIFGETVLIILVLPFLNIKEIKDLFHKRRFTYLILFIILLVGTVVHTSLWDTDIDLELQDIYYTFLDGSRLVNGENPYARVLRGDMRINHKYATYFPIFFYLAWGTQKLGLHAFLPWLSFWRIIFLTFNLAVASLLFWVPYQRGITAFAILAAGYWLFNRWALNITSTFSLEPIPIFFLIMSLVLFTRHQILSLIFYGLSLGIKQLAIFMIPLFLIWVWQTARKNPLNQTLKAGLVMASIPFITSLPFLIWNAEGYIRSILFSATRVSENQFGAPSLDHWLGLVGIPAKLPLLAFLSIVYLLAWQRRIGRFGAALLVIVLFVDFNSVLFNQYFIWSVPLILLAVYELTAGKEEKTVISEEGKTGRHEQVNKRLHQWKPDSIE